MVRAQIVLAIAGILSCQEKSHRPSDSSDAARATDAPRTSSPVSTATVPNSVSSATGANEAVPNLSKWLESHMPKGGTVSGMPPKIFHTVAAGDTAKKIAADYLELTEVYLVHDLEALIEKKYPSLAQGAKIEIPMPLTSAPLDPEKERLPLPEDQSLRGVFLTGQAGSKDWIKTLDKMVERGMNAVVLDGKDYMGPITYPTKAKIAVETKANLKPSLPNLARTIRFAHMRKVHVILRNSCFHDPWTDKHAPRLSLKHPTTGQPAHHGWLDPTNEEVQDYIIELVKEQVAAGADEIQLDYVRFPVDLSTSIVKFPPQKERSNVMRGFIKRVHEITKAHNMTLSLDLFGVAATGTRDDIEKLGQDIATVSQEAEAISPMVYPSHYSKGYNGWESPGDHPEIVGIGTKAAVVQLQKAGLKTAVRSWIQAFGWRTPTYSPAHVAAQVRHAEANGGKGWLMWSPNCEYGTVWRAFPPIKKE